MLVVDSPAMDGKDAVFVGGSPPVPPTQPNLADVFAGNRDMAAEAAQTLHLRGWGYAPGDYYSRCIDCDQAHIMDKRAWRCVTCAQKKFDAKQEQVIESDVAEVRASLGEDVSDADALVAVMAPGFKVVPREKEHTRVLYDHDIPAFVRGFIAMNQGAATETMAITEAGYMPRLYATYTPDDGTEPFRVRVVMVSRLGDVGISRKDEDGGYFKRLSIYDLTDFDTVMHPGAPAKRKAPIVRYALADKDGNWVRINPVGSVVPFAKSEVPVLYANGNRAYKAKSAVDRIGLLGLKTVPITLTVGSEDDA